MKLTTKSIIACLFFYCSVGTHCCCLGNALRWSQESTNTQRETHSVVMTTWIPFFPLERRFSSLTTRGAEEAYQFNQHMHISRSYIKCCKSSKSHAPPERPVDGLIVTESRALLICISRWLCLIDGDSNRIIDKSPDASSCTCHQSLELHRTARCHQTTGMHDRNRLLDLVSAFQCNS